MYSQVLIQPYTIMPLRIREMIIVLSIYQGIIVCKKILIMSNSLISDWILTKGASNGAISAFDVQSIQSLTNQCSFDGTEYCTCSISNFKQLAIYFCNKKFKLIVCFLHSVYVRYILICEHFYLPRSADILSPSVRPSAW